MRVATGGLSHESSTFTPVPTTVESYRERFLLEGEEILSTFARDEYADRRLYRGCGSARL